MPPISSERVAWGTTPSMSHLMKRRMTLLRSLSARLNAPPAKYPMPAPRPPAMISASKTAGPGLVNQSLEQERDDDGHHRRGGKGKRDFQAENHLKSLDI